MQNKTNPSQDIDILSFSSANNLDNNLIIKVIYNKIIKFKHVIKQINTKSVQQLKTELIEKLNNNQNLTIQENDVILTDKDDFELDNNNILADLISQNDLIQIVDKQKAQEPIQQLKPQQQEKDNNIQIPQQIQQQKQKLPEEAIVVLYDVSGSMGCSFYQDRHISRMGATNAFFSAFADKIMAYESKNLLSLICFDDNIETKCQFIDDYQLFINLVDSCKPGSCTKLYDSVYLAIQELKEIKKQYPDIILRIIALTDGEDNSSSSKPEQLSQEIVENGIILDSFVVSSSCIGLKKMTHASGGRCYNPQDLNEGLSLFEIETIISAKSRGIEKSVTDKTKTINWEEINKKDFDSEGIQKKPQNYEKKVMDAQQLIKKMQNSQNSINQNTNTSTNTNNVKRIIKELQKINSNPNFYYIIFPVADDVNSWKALIKGQKGSLYEEGIFQISIKFPTSYPMKPPVIEFVTPIYHCNFSTQGTVCLNSILDGWSPAFGIQNSLQDILTLMQNPNTDNALNSTIAAQMLDKDEQDQFKLKVKEQIQQYAKPDIDTAVNGIMGEGADNTSEAYISLKKQIQDWINLKNE